MISEDLIKWLLKGDVSIQYQVNRDLLGNDSKKLQNKISEEGWGKRFLSFQNHDGHWGRGFYTPKWKSTHYTLLDLKNLNVSPKIAQIQKAIKNVLTNEMSPGAKMSRRVKIVSSDICVNGMFLNYASYFNSREKDLESIVDYLLENQMEDGGFNCHSTRIGAVHSSLHTTLSVLEGLYEFRRNGYKYRLAEIRDVENQCSEFIMQHRLFKSDKTDQIIKNDFIRFPYPPRWRYDVLRCLDFFSYAGYKYDERMKDAVDLIISKRKKDGKWLLAAKYPGEIHFEMERAGQPSRWNTLRALRILKHFKII